MFDTQPIIQSSTAISPTVAEYDSLLNALERILPLVEQNESQFLKDIVLIFVAGFVLIILLMATANGYTARALTQIRQSSAMGILETAYENSPDFIQDGIDATEDTTQWIHHYLKQHQPHSQLTVTVGSMQQFLDELSDGIPIKEADKALYGDPGITPTK